MNKKLFLLDAMALIYRAYFAFSKNHRINSKGVNTSAMLGFTNTLLDLLKNQQPTHIGVAFDTKVPTQRHVDFAAYKANRQAMPEDLVASLPYIDKILEAFRIPKIYADGFEADDVIGTLAKEAERQGFKTYMVTPDKDFAQLVSDNIFIYKPSRMGNEPEVLGVKEVLERFNIKRPEQVIDILALWGDASDNIPGIPGIGEKRAKELIQQYDSIENIIANANELKGKMKDNVLEFAQQGLQSKQLATIILDAPVQLNIEALEYEQPDYDKLKVLFEELEFRTLAERIFSGLGKNVNKNVEKIEAKPKPKEATLDMFANVEETEEITSLKPLSESHCNYLFINDLEETKSLVNTLIEQKNVAIHLITTNDNPHQAELAGIAFCTRKSEAFFIPFSEDYNTAVEQLAVFEPFFKTPKCQLIGFDLKYIISILSWYKIKVTNKLFDVMLAHYIIEPDMKHDIKIFAEDILKVKMISSSELIGKNSTFRDIDSKLITDYACQKVDVLFQLQPIFYKNLENTNTLNLFENVEIPLLEVLAAVETQGIKLDVEILNKYSDFLAQKINETEKTIYQLAGHEFNISSPKQMGVVLFEELKITSKPKMTKTKQYKTGEEILTKLKDKHEIVTHILDYRTLSKLKSTYVDALPKLVNPRTGKIHTTYNQAVAATGRLSSNNPNLQNIPVRTAEGREIRKAFVPTDENYTLLAADYSQIELRIIAHLSQDENMLADFREGKDIHTATAARVYNVPETEVTKDMRRNAKSVNFGIVYGISAFGLSENLDISRHEAKEIIDNYFINYSGVKLFIESQIEIAKENGFVETILKRRRYLRDINSTNAVVRQFAERNAINAPIQGSSADMIKIAMINIYAEMKKLNMKSKMILQVHDELVFDCHLSEKETLSKIVVELMKSAMPLSLPIEVDVNNGLNWLEAH